MKSNNTRSFLLHLAILILGIVIIFNNVGILDWLINGVGFSLFYILINLLYIGFGYLYGADTGKASQNLLSFGLIAWVGIGVDSDVTPF